MGGWVGEKVVVCMRCCRLGLGGWVGRTYPVFVRGGFFSSFLR